MLVPITRERVDRQKQFTFSQVSFLNPPSLTFEKSSAPVSAESTSVIVPGKEKTNGKPKTQSVSILKISCLQFFALHSISF